MNNKYLLFVGHKSSGKTEFIRRLLQKQYDSKHLFHYSLIKVCDFMISSQSEQYKFQITNINSKVTELSKICPITEYFTECFVFCNLNAQHSVSIVEYYIQLFKNTNTRVIVIGTLLNQQNKTIYYDENIKQLKKYDVKIYQHILEIENSQLQLLKNIYNIIDIEKFTNLIF